MPRGTIRSIRPFLKTCTDRGFSRAAAALLVAVLALAATPVVESPTSGAPADRVDAAYRVALELYRSGQFREALQAIRGASEQGQRSAGLYSLAGWCRLRLGEIREAENAFRAALTVDAGALDPRVGLGYVLLRKGAPSAAADEFEAVLGSDPENADAIKGLGLARRNQGRLPEAAEALRRALALAPDDDETKDILEQVMGAQGVTHESRPRPAVPASRPLSVVARAGDGRLEIAGLSGFRPIFVKGVNRGVALPGRFPAEFPQKQDTYEDWLAQVGAMGANVVRLYTLLPPVFYAALEAHNKKDPERPLWLVQGVWTEPPPGDDYAATGFDDEFKAEIRRVVDAVHGNLDQPARPGHASGAYRADVSASTLAWLLGREWEPYSVQRFDRKGQAAERAAFHGDYFEAAAEATPFESWLASTLDYATGYETTQYRQQRPVAFVSWPTLDPLTHPTEATVEEEVRLRRERGGPPGPPIREYDNDGVSVDALHILAGKQSRAGQYASYHAYPYYPDFMSLDPGYGRARDSEGPCNYIGYLRDLVRHHGSQPVLIAEFGVPSSRGMAHRQAQGFDHGGHSETRQGEIDAHLLRDIHEAGLAGGILFALLDEWFKRNWLVTEFEIPADRNPLWLNALDPEQNYGVLAARPGGHTWKVSIDGRPEDWNGIKPLVEKRTGGPEVPLDDGHDGARTLRGLAVASDEAYLYLRLDVEKLDADGDGAPDWSEAAYVIGIDTYDEKRGDRRLPVNDRSAPAGRTASPAGLEFCLILDGEKTARLLVDAPYDIATHRTHRPYGSVANADGRYIEIKQTTNRDRLGRDGTAYPAQEYSLSPLRHGSIDRRDSDYNTLADWRVGRTGDFIEVRLGWGLLNVTDPSSRRVLHDNPDDLRAIGTVVTPGFRFIAAAIKPAGAPGGATPVAGRVTDRLPAGDALSARDLPLYSWNGWERPAYRIERKDTWTILKAAFAALPSGPAGE